MAAYMVCFGSPEGQMVLDNLRAVFHDHPCSLEPTHALVSEAQRSVFLSIMNFVEEGRRNAAGEPSGHVITDEPTDE